MELLRDYALSLLHTPYRWGGDDPSGWDCSGLVQEILASCGLDPEGDQTAQSLFNYFEANGRSQWDVRGLGSLVFYGPSVTQVSHVAFMLDRHRIIEAGGGGSKTLTDKDAITQNAFVRVRHISRRADIAAVLKPRYAMIGMI